MSPSTHHRRLACLLWCAATILFGLIWRMAPLGLPPFLFKYGGSALLAITVYTLVAAIVPSLTPLRAALIACLIAAAVELSRLVHTPASDAFRLTLAGRLMLGRFFAVSDIVAYWLAIAAAAALDQAQSHRVKT